MTREAKTRVKRPNAERSAGLHRGDYEKQTQLPKGATGHKYLLNKGLKEIRLKAGDGKQTQFSGHYLNAPSQVDPGQSHEICHGDFFLLPVLARLLLIPNLEVFSFLSHSRLIRWIGERFAAALATSSICVQCCRPLIPARIAIARMSCSLWAIVAGSGVCDKGNPVVPAGVSTMTLHVFIGDVRTVPRGVNRLLHSTRMPTQGQLLYFTQGLHFKKKSVFGGFLLTVDRL